MTLTELAERIGITLANLSILKTSKARAIRFSTLDALCRALQCQPGDIWSSSRRSDGGAAEGTRAVRHAVSPARKSRTSRKVAIDQDRSPRMTHPVGPRPSRPHGFVTGRRGNHKRVMSCVMRAGRPRSDTLCRPRENPGHRARLLSIRIDLRACPILSDRGRPGRAWFWYRAGGGGNHKRVMSCVMRAGRPRSDTLCRPRENPGHRAKLLSTTIDLRA